MAYGVVHQFPGGTQESWERFRDETLMPALGAGVEGGFASPPQETEFPVHNQQTR